MAQNLPNTVRVLNGGIAGLKAFALFEQCQDVILVDAMSYPEQARGAERFEDGHLPNFGAIYQVYTRDH